jgi:hypothetical protein
VKPAATAGFTRGWGENHLSQQPVPGTRFAGRNMERAAPGSPIWPCTRWGFPCLLACARSGGLLLHLFTLAVRMQARARRFVFCGTVRQDASRHRFPRVSERRGIRLRGIAPFGVRTFLPLRVAPEKAILRLSKIESSIRRDEPDLKQGLLGNASLFPN